MKVEDSDHGLVEMGGVPVNKTESVALHRSFWIIDSEGETEGIPRRLHVSSVIRRFPNAFPPAKSQVQLDNKHHPAPTLLPPPTR